MSRRIIVFSGIDGCGKTTLIERLVSDVRARGETPRVVWMRYCHYLTRVLFLFSRLVGLTKYEFHEGRRIVGYHDLYRSKIISYCFIVTLWLDTLVTTLCKVYLPAWFTGRVIICDRWVPKYSYRC